MNAFLSLAVWWPELTCAIGTNMFFNGFRLLTFMKFISSWPAFAAAKNTDATFGVSINSLHVLATCCSAHPVTSIRTEITPHYLNQNWNHPHYLNQNWNHPRYLNQNWNHPVTSIITEITPLPQSELKSPPITSIRTEITPITSIRTEITPVTSIRTEITPLPQS